MSDPLRRKGGIFFLLTIFSLLLVWGCAVPQRVCVRDGVPYCQARGNFTGRWYDYYERALSCMEGGCYQAALADLEEAIRLRGTDQRRARTVGMHFVDYFPHREKGLIHYLEGDYPAAKAELEWSLAQYPSEKARFYLDETRTRLLRQTGQAPGKPRLTLTLPTSDPAKVVWTRDDPIRIAGVAVDERQFISDIFIDDMQVFMEASEPEVAFSEDLYLAEGRCEIRVRVRNLMGGETRQRLQLQVDRTGPMIAIDRFVPGKTISGSLLDPAGVASLQINGQAAPFSSGTPAFFTSDLDSMTALLTTEDRLGNETRFRVEKGGLSGESAAGWLAWRGENRVMTDGREPVDLSRIARIGKTPLRIDIKGVSDPQIIFSETLRLDVEVRSEADLGHLSVNGRAVPFHQGRLISFNAFLRLEPGENPVTITAADAEGRNVEKKVRIIRKIPEAFQLRHRYGISIHPFEFSEDNPKGIRFQHDMLAGLLAPRRFRVAVSEDLQRLLDRQGLTTDATAHGASPHAVLLGVVHETRTGIEAAARMVNIETRETLAVGDVYAPSPGREDLAAMGRRLSEKFLRNFPLLAAEIVDVSENRVHIALSDQGTGKKTLPPDWPLIVYRFTETGDQAMGRDARIIGDAMVTGGATGNVFTAVMNAGTAAAVRPTDRVVAR